MKHRTPESNGNGVSGLATTTKEHDQLIERLLRDPRKSEAIKWLEGARDGQRTLGRHRTAGTSAKLVRNLYGLGASEVLAVQIQPGRNGDGQHTGKLVVKLPQEAERRKAIFGWCQEQGDSLGFSPDLDRGESHLFLLLD
ncbi:MAG: hypothetical protein L0Z50_28540 [Verrucomicrobiales bacterium]|nr:hypothetical protein [Verrucomicrobiales bacterium]